jgi:hypothetical protein
LLSVIERVLSVTLPLIRESVEVRFRRKYNVKISPEVGIISDKGFWGAIEIIRDTSGGLSTRQCHQMTHRGEGCFQKCHVTIFEDVSDQF